MKEIVVAFAHVFAMMAPWLVFGFLMAGIVAVLIPRNWVNRVMGGSSGFRGILRAVAIGVPLPICSCGVLPIAAGLRKHGAGKGPTAALLVSTPQTGIDSRPAGDPDPRQLQPHRRQRLQPLPVPGGHHAPVLRLWRNVLRPYQTLKAVPGRIERFDLEYARGLVLLSEQGVTTALDFEFKSRMTVIYP